MTAKTIYQYPVPHDAEIAELDIPKHGKVRLVAWGMREERALIATLLGKPKPPELVEFPVLFVEAEINDEKVPRFFGLFPHGMPIEAKAGLRAEFVQVLLSERTGTVKYVYELIKESAEG